MRVKAIKQGFYGGSRRAPGDVFAIPDDEKPGSWMEPLSVARDTVGADGKTAAVLAAIAALNPADDAHWTKDGAPNCNVLSEACGFTVTRDLLKDAAPEAKRPVSE